MQGVLGSGERGADAKSIDLGSSGKQIGDLFAWEIPFVWHYTEFSGVTVCKGRSFMQMIRSETLSQARSRRSWRSIPRALT